MIPIQMLFEDPPPPKNVIWGGGALNCKTIFGYNYDFFLQLLGGGGVRSIWACLVACAALCCILALLAGGASGPSLLQAEHWNPSDKIGTVQRRLAWPLRQDDTHKSRREPKS